MLIQKAPRNFKGIELIENSHAENGVGQAFISYKYIDENGELGEFNVFYRRYKYKTEEMSAEIIDDPGVFTNSFKVVRLSDGLFGYVREEDGVLLPERFLIAGEFDEHGFAMVGKENGVTFIDKDFNAIASLKSYRNGNESFAPLRLLDLKGLDPLRFNDGQGNACVPQAVIGYLHNRFFIGHVCFRNLVSYVDLEGNVKSFYKYGVDVPEKWFTTLPNNDKSDILESLYAKRFNKDGYLVLDNLILFEAGYYSTFEDITNLLIQSGNPFIKNLSEILIKGALNSQDDTKHFTMKPNDSK